nr:hypothetical protein [Tanacetum cinerariifolium]
MIKMKMKNPPLDQTGGQREVGLEKEPESTSAPKEKTSKSSGKSKEGSKSHQEHTGKSTQAEEPIHHPDWFKKPSKPTTPDRD